MICKTCDLYFEEACLADITPDEDECSYYEEYPAQMELNFDEQ